MLSSGLAQPLTLTFGCPTLSHFCSSSLKILPCPNPFGSKPTNSQFWALHLTLFTSGSVFTEWYGSLQGPQQFFHKHNFCLNSLIQQHYLLKNFYIENYLIHYFQF